MSSEMALQDLSPTHASPRPIIAHILPIYIPDTQMFSSAPLPHRTHLNASLFAKRLDRTIDSPFPPLIWPARA